MRLREIFHIVTLNMIENKFRLLLTTLGIIVGTITIILVIAIGKGGEREAARQFSNLSADTIYVNLDYTALAAGKDVTTVEKLAPELLDKIMEESTTLQGIYLRASGFQEISYNGKKQSASLVGVTPGYAEISNISFEQGADFSEFDFEDGERVAVIGSKLAEKLFGTDPVVGSYIKLGDARYRIVGLLKRSEDGLQGVDTDSSLFIPYSAMEKDELLDPYATTQAVGKALAAADAGRHLHHLLGLLQRVDDIRREKPGILLGQLHVPNIHRHAALVGQPHPTHGAAAQVCIFSRIPAFCIQGHRPGAQLIFQALVVVIELLIDHAALLVRLFKDAVGQRRIDAAGGAPLVRQLGGQLAQTRTAFALWDTEQIAQFTDELGFLPALDALTFGRAFQNRLSFFRRGSRLRLHCRRHVGCGCFSFRCRRRRWLRAVFPGNVLVQRAGAIQVYAAFGAQAVETAQAAVIC